MTTRPPTVTLQLPAKIFTGIRWTGENLRDVQDFMLPASPLRNLPVENETQYTEHKFEKLGVLVYDPIATGTYAGLGSQFKIITVTVGDWILADEKGAFSVVTNVHASQLIVGGDQPLHLFAPLEQPDPAPAVGPDYSPSVADA